ncbi:cysteine protease atg4 [Biomphalaria glabrata]|nr:cysteine protease atg4 [Biomphalaria glabrata]
MNLSRERHKYESQKNEDIGIASADDVLSLNSWSDKLNLSTSSSSDSSFRQGKASSCEIREKERPSKTKKKVLLPERPFSHTKNTVLNSASSNFSKDDHELDSPTLSRTSLTLFDYDCPSTDQHEPSFSIITHDEVDSSHSGSQLNSFYGIKNFSKTKNKAGLKKAHTSTPSGYGIYPNLDQFYESNYSCETTDNVKLKENISKPEPKQDLRHNQRPRFFDYSNFNSKPSKSLVQRRKDSQLDNQPDTFSSLPTSLSQSHSEQSYGKLAGHGPPASRMDHGGIQSKALSMERLYNSQPQLSSMGKKTTKFSPDLWEHKLEPENIKMKVKSVWNNLRYKYGYEIKSSFNANMKPDSPLYLLGRCYHRRKQGHSSTKDTLPEDPTSEDEFTKDFISRIWLTYRNNFYPIPGTTLNSDCGWGCMLRSGQMLIAQCLVTHYLTRDWRIHDKQNETQGAYYREIIRWFSEPLDAPSDKNPFCLHHLAHFGRLHKKDPGQWYGPSSVAYIFRDAFSQAYQSVPILSQLCVYVAQDCTVYIDDVVKLCTAKNRSESTSSSNESTNDGATSSSTGIEADAETWLRSVIILIPMRLGGEVINEIYIPCIKGLLSYSNCMGIIGGKPKHSLYFLGYQDDQLIYLDPHKCHEAVDTSNPNFKIETYHCTNPRKMSVTKMDPSCTVGFYIHDAKEFKKFVHEVKEFTSPAKQRGIYPLFIFDEGSHQDSNSQAFTGEKGRVRVTHYHLDENGQRKRTFSRDSEDFVLL